MATELNTKNNLKRLDLTGGLSSFMANGKKYFIESTMSIERYTKFQQLELELSFNLSFKQLFDTLNTVYDLLNKGKLADASVHVYNAMRGFANLEEKEPFVLKYCALFINEENEDRRIITDDMITKKIEDWQEEGYAIQDFLALALYSIPDYIKSYQKHIQNISEKNQE